MANYFDRRAAKKRKKELEIEYIKKDKEFDHFTLDKDKLTRRAIWAIEAENDDKPLSDEKKEAVSKFLVNIMDYIQENRDRYLEHFKDVIKRSDEVSKQDPNWLQKMRLITSELMNRIISIGEDSLSSEDNALLTETDKRIIYVTIKVGFINPYTRHLLNAKKYGDMIRSEDAIINSKKNYVDY